MWYLLGAGVSEEEPTVGLPWVAVVVNKVAAAVGAAGATAATVGGVAGGAAAGAAVAGGAAAGAAVARGVTVGGGEELRTLGQKS